MGYLFLTHAYNKLFTHPFSLFIIRVHGIGVDVHVHRIANRFNVLIGFPLPVFSHS